MRLILDFYRQVCYNYNMLSRLIVYTTIVLSFLFVLQVNLNLRKRLLHQEYDCLYKDVETKIRLHHIDQRLLDKKIAKLRKDLGIWNSELNPYE